jgi:gamma-glutamyltranspeptidase/glutathione hydrolase
VAQVLNLVAGFDLSALDRAAALHWLLEAERLAFSDRNAYLGDPEFVDVPVPGLLSAAYAEQRRLSLPESPPRPPYLPAVPGNPLPFQHDPSPSLTTAATAGFSRAPEGLSTTHLTVADSQGRVVSYTLTLESTGGSGIVVPDYGFLLNNELTDFNTEMPHPNVPEPGKRPRSSMAPTIAVAPDGSILAFGSPGGSTIITTVLGIAVNIIDFGMDLEAAIAAPRLSQRNTDVTLVDQDLESTEPGMSLLNRGHQLRPTETIGAATGILVKPDGSLIAVAEPVRRGGGSTMTVK